MAYKAFKHLSPPQGVITVLNTKARLGYETFSSALPTLIKMGYGHLCEKNAKIAEMKEALEEALEQEAEEEKALAEAEGSPPSATATDKYSRGGLGFYYDVEGNGDGEEDDNVSSDE